MTLSREDQKYQYKRLRDEFWRVVNHATDAELEDHKISPSFYYPDSHQRMILEAHYRLIEEGKSYAQRYQVYKQAVEKMKADFDGSWKISLIKRLPALQLVFLLTPVFFPLDYIMMEFKQSKLFSAFEKAPEVDSLMRKPFPGPVPML